MADVPEQYHHDRYRLLHGKRLLNKDGGVSGNGENGANLGKDGGGAHDKDGVIWGGQGFNPGREVEAHSEDTQDNLDNGNDKSEKRK